MEITDAIAEGLMRTVIKNAKILVDDPNNYDARAEIMWSGSLSPTTVSPAAETTAVTLPPSPGT